MNASQIRERLNFTDEKLLAECELQRYRASGPGGQKRNKTDSAVRLIHTPSGCSATATESRSQHDNRRKALRRLRFQLAIQFRMPSQDRPEWPTGIQPQGTVLKVRPNNPSIPLFLALILDEIHCHAGHIRKVAAARGVSTSSLVRVLASVPLAFQEVNRQREEWGLGRLKR